MANYTVKVLTLYKDLCYTADTSIDKSNFLYRYTCAVPHRELEPRLSQFLVKPRFEGYALTEQEKNSAEGEPKGEISKSHAHTIGSRTGIPAGRYLFLQGFMPVTEIPDGDDKENPADKTGQKKRIHIYRQAAEHLHTEALWKEIDFYDDTVYIRTLKEGRAEVFQLFRKITAGKTD
ncbi:hypothetical protein [Treponema sp.]|uniref:hypothetical protein n=1 Tax=Treponema sp. TaxID=166 RepID=UPI003FA31278